MGRETERLCEDLEQRSRFPYDLHIAKRLRAALEADPEQPSVDWLDPARESCLIDGVRYRRERVKKHRTKRLAWVPDEMEYATKDGEIVRYRLVTDRPMQSDRSPGGRWRRLNPTTDEIEEGEFPARRPVPVEREES